MSLRSNYVMLLNELNVNSVLPVMHAEYLLSQDEYRILQEMSGHKTERERRDKLLMYLPRKGKDFYTLFCECIVWSGQIELAERMGFDVASVENPNKYGANAPPTVLNTPNPIQPIYPPTPNPVTYVTRPPPPVAPSVPPPTTKNVLVLYCKDHLLQTTPEIPLENRRTAEDYCLEVSHFVETLTLLSNNYDNHGRMYQAYDFTYDKKMATDGEFISNFLSWSDTAMSNCTLIVLLCSPQLVALLNDDHVKVIQMEQGMFHKDSLINAFTHKTTIPVFLNMPKQPHWTPRPLQYGSSYVANIRALQEGCMGVRDEIEWRERVKSLLSDDRRLDDLVELRKVLLKDQFSTTPVGTPVQVPPILIENHFRQQLNDLAAEVSFIWQGLATKLGVSFTVQQRIQSRTVDCNQKTQMMFDEWVDSKREKATKQALVLALRECKYNAIADRVERTFN